VPHTCHAPGCERRVPAKLFACRTHWFALPKDLRDAVSKEYRPGQEKDKRPSWRYMAVQRLACAHLSFKPNDEKAALESAYFLQQALAYRTRSMESGLGDPFVGIASMRQALEGAPAESGSAR
jgi:hypothetical protein